MDLEQTFNPDKEMEQQIQREGKFTRTLERQTAKIPSAAYLGLAAGAVLLSAGLAMSERRKGWANFVGLWVPSILLFGVYNKIVKTGGSDRIENKQMVH